MGLIVRPVCNPAPMNDRQEAKNAKKRLREPSERVDDFARRVIGAAIEVHRHLGPGFSEQVYEEALALEFALGGVPYERQPAIEIRYKGRLVGWGRPDFVVGGVLVVELKAVSVLSPAHDAQLISYLKAVPSQLGLLLNFKETTLRRGIKRVVWTHDSSSQRQQETGHVNEAHVAYESLVVARRDSAIPLQVVKEDFDAIA